MDILDIVVSVVVVGGIILIYLGLGNQWKDVHGCTGGGLTVEKSTKESD